MLFSEVKTLVDRWFYSKERNRQQIRAKLAGYLVVLKKENGQSQLVYRLRARMLLRT